MIVSVTSVHRGKMITHYFRKHRADGETEVEITGTAYGQKMKF